jgi:hypothetical protein
MSDSDESVGPQIIVEVLVAVAAAAVGYLISYLDAHRKDQMALVSAQIEKLYGPLFALTEANNAAWDQFQHNYWPKRVVFFEPGFVLRPEDVELWRRWMRNVFQPMNEKMEDAIVNNSQLLVGEQFPPMFQQLLSHTEAYKAVIANWKDGAIGANDLSEEANISPVPFPPQPAFTNCVVNQSLSLKLLQQQLQEQFIGWFSPLKEEIVSECRAGRQG